MPSGPSVTACTAAVFVTIVKTMSLHSATSRGVSAHAMPASSSGCAFSRVRFQPVTEWPASSRRRAMPPPITPSPTYPSSATLASRGQRTVDVGLDAREVVAHLLACPVGVARGDRVTDGEMLLGRALRAVGDDEDGHERAPDQLAQRAHACGG